jgi:PAS domain S-box-containing protein
MAELKILLVEDESIEAMDIKRTLESFDYEVPYIASSGEEAIQKALEIMPDLILIDIILKGEIDGIEAVSKIKELNIPVIFLTAHSEESTIERAKLTEPYGYLSKPYVPNELKIAIELAIYKNHMDKELKESEKRFYMLFRNSPLPYQSLDENGFLLDVNPAWLECLGYSKDEVIGKNFSEFLSPNYGEHFKKNFPLFKSAGEIHDVQFQMKHKDGSHIFVSYEGKIGYDELGHFKQTHCIFQDITERISTQERIDKLYRLYTTLSQINQSIVRIKSRKELFKTICNVCVEYGKFQMAWIGIIDDQTGNIIPVEYSGDEKGYLKKISLNIKESPSLHKPSLMSIEKGECNVIDDIEKDLNSEWRDEALKRNYQSLASIPFKLNGKILGILYIYSSKPYFFIEEEIDLVKEIGLDISFALDSIKTEEEKKLTKNALIKSEKNYRELVDNSLVAIYKTNLDGDILFANDSMAKMFHYERVDELKEENIKKLYKNNEDRYQLINKLEKESRIRDYELEIVAKDNQTVNVLVSASLEDDIISGMFMDISDRKQSEEKFRSIIHNSTDLIRILDKDGLITFDSPSSTRILGYSEGYFIGKNPLEFIHPDDLERVRKDLDEVYKNINPGTPTEFRIRKEDGSYIPVESVSQNMTHNPNIEGIIVTTHPIHQRKEMENALLESEEKYRTLFEEDPDYTILIGTDGILLDVNNATINMAGLSRHELIGKNFSELKIIPPEDIELHLDKINRLLQDELVKPYESRLIDKEGNIRWTLIHFIAVKEKENISYILGIATDITVQKLAENELRSSLKEKNILLQEIHHRVKNNMQIISSLLNLQIKYVDEEEAVNVLIESQNRVQSMAMIHEKLYESENLTNINFIEYIQSLVSNLFHSYNVKNSRIKTILEIDKVNLNMETAIPCGLIISETVSNCLKYAFPNDMSGEIFISLKSIDIGYELIIRDNGIGLPEKLEFSKLESLGLLLVNNLTEQIDGELKINKQNPTEFKITFKELEYKNRI